MIKIKSVNEAEVGDLIKDDRKLSVITSIYRKQNLYIIGLDNGIDIECLPEAKKEIFRFEPLLTRNH